MALCPWLLPGTNGCILEIVTGQIAHKHGRHVGRRLLREQAALNREGLELQVGCLGAW